MHTDEAVLEVRNLRKEFVVRGAGRRTPNFVAVDDISFSLERGGSLAIVGESGSGKTTLARMVMGLERPTSGTIAFGGEMFDPRRATRRVRRAHARAVQMVFQDPYSSLDPRQSIGSMLAEVIRLHFDPSATEIGSRVEKLAEQVGLDTGHLSALPGRLSGGQRQRAAIARALAAEPDVLVLDEAVAALDVSIQAQILNLLADLRGETGVSYLFISHDLAVVRQITDQVMVMHHGKVVETGRTVAVLDAPQDAYTRRLRNSVPTPGWDLARILSE